jgi:hypothetical protein
MGRGEDDCRDAVGPRAVALGARRRDDDRKCMSIAASWWPRALLITASSNTAPLAHLSPAPRAGPTYPVVAVVVRSPTAKVRQNCLDGAHPVGRARAALQPKLRQLGIVQISLEKAKWSFAKRWPRGRFDWHDRSHAIREQAGSSTSLGLFCQHPHE